MAARTFVALGPEFTTSCKNGDTKVPPSVKILVICGSLRKESFNRMIVNTLPELAPDGMRFEECPSFATLPMFDDDVLKNAGLPTEIEIIANAIRDADGILFVSPEYNFSVPGALKNMLDWISRIPDHPLQKKPVAIQSAATGPVGGTRMQYHLRQIMIFLDARVLNKPEIFVTHARERFDAKTGRLVDEASRSFVGSQLVAFKSFVGEMTH